MCLPIPRSIEDVSAGRVKWTLVGLYEKDEIEMFLEVGRRHPDLPIILGHGMGEDGVRLAQRTKNVYLDLSGTYPEGNPVRAAIDGAGKDRVVFGTDLDLITPAFAMGVYYEAGMSEEEERLVMAENARRIHPIPGT